MIPLVDSEILPGRADLPALGLVPSPPPIAPVVPTSTPRLLLPSVEQRLYTSGFEFNFFQAVWLLERLQPHRRPVGREGSPAAEVLRFQALPSLNFPPSAIQELQPPPSPAAIPRMVVAFMGLTGPSGVLPRHYTELVMRLEREAKGSEKQALRAWFDLFNHRAISLFFRAWEKYRFYVPYARGEYGRPEPDAFTTALFSLCGLGMPSLRGRLLVPAQYARPSDSRPAPCLRQIKDLALLRYCGLLAQRPRCAANLRTLIADFFQLPTEVRQFQGQWLLLQQENQTCLGASTPIRIDNEAPARSASEGSSGVAIAAPTNRHDPPRLAQTGQSPARALGAKVTDPLKPARGARASGANNRLGQDAVVGRRVWDVQSKLRLRLGPLTYRQFLELLPDPEPSRERKTLFLLSHLARLFLGPELDFDVQLVLARSELPDCRLKPPDQQDPLGPRLGWNTWLHSEEPPRDADDATFVGAA